MKTTFIPLLLFPFFLGAQAAAADPEAIWSTVRLILRRWQRRGSEPYTDPA
jgi:hypothetical protein